jgi:hypothetical protein
VNADQRTSLPQYEYDDMTETLHPPTDEIRAALHGARVGHVGEVYCDYHNHPTRIPTEEPIMYDCIKVVELPDWEPLLDPPETWLLDAARCRECETDALEYPTHGYAEALVMLTLTEANDILSIDAATLTVLDYSPAHEGSLPPTTDAMLALEDDVGIARWTRLLKWLETDPPQPIREHLEHLIAESPDAPS